MYDNGLLKYYKNNTTKNEYLDADKMAIIKKSTRDVRISRCTIGGKSYYTKEIGCSTVNTYQADAEILLSQIYTKFGLKSAIYLPAESETGRFLISDDVKKSNSVLARNYLLENNASYDPYHIPFLSKPPYDDDYSSNLFTDNCLVQQTKMRILDTASYNVDRHSSNYFYVLQHKFEEPEDNHSLGSKILGFYRNLALNKSLIPNKAKDVMTIDFESSGESVYSMLQDGEDNIALDLYKNDFRKDYLNRDEMLFEFANNEKLDELINKKEVAEEIGSLNPGAVAKDIYETTGYEINPMLVSVLSRSYDDMANLLCQSQG